MGHIDQAPRRTAFLASSGLWQDLRLGVRVLLRKRVSTAAAVATLAIGIGCGAAIFTFVGGVADVLLTVALAACVAPARRAASAVPMAVLRSD